MLPLINSLHLADRPGLRSITMSIEWQLYSRWNGNQVSTTGYSEPLISCDGTSCLNEGVCQNIAGKLRCFCPEPFHGQFCQLTSEDSSFEWAATEIVLLFIIGFLVACAVGMICCR
ncbi:hypothetical protein Y032_0685g1512 [Ancylostoma ceylanicum]|uniref:EGF-like domain-containing protein n=1 Tax=Ancylostoma ceylanicum TaxID=53326 RepID=A0A016WIT5_9BILA|nr:hypothetical protein Y032_0685g1512 [Ancylostoma ceylanicum]